MANKKATNSNNSKAAAKRAANAAASGLQVSGTTLAPVPTPPALPPATSGYGTANPTLPATPANPVPPAPPLPALASNSPTPPAHFTPEEVALGTDPDGTWVAANIATARIINAYQQAQQAMRAASLPMPGVTKRYVSKTDANSNYHNRTLSTVQKPVAIVHGLCASMAGNTRKAIIAAAVAQGVNPNTAATQYSMYMLKNKAA